MIPQHRYHAEIIRKWALNVLHLRIQDWQIELLLEHMAPERYMSKRSIPEELAKRTYPDGTTLADLEKEDLRRKVWMELLLQGVVPLTVPEIIEEIRPGDFFMAHRELTCEVYGWKPLEEARGKAQERKDATDQGGAEDRGCV